MTKTEVLAQLNERYIKISESSPDSATTNRTSIQHVLAALDSKYSYYVVLSADERAHVRTEWLALATRLGVLPKKSRSSKPRRVPALPLQVLEFFNTTECLPHRPRATDDYTQGTRRTSWVEAQNLRSIELNPPCHIYWLIFDCDHRESERWKSAGLPQPSFITINPCNGHHHVAYRLSTPVCRSEHARTRPLRYLRAVQEAMRLALGSDPFYAGLLTKNPLHFAWVTIRPQQMPAYSLAELAATVDLRMAGSTLSGHSSRSTRTAAALAQVGVGGRNNALFDAVRLRPAADEDIQGRAERCNALFSEPLSPNEVVGIVKSIKRYESSKRHATSLDTFTSRQTERGRRGGRPQTTGKDQPWASAGVSKSTWYRQQAKTPGDDHQRSGKMRAGGRPITTKVSQPWEAQGVSRATWYRRQQRCHVAVRLGETKPMGQKPYQITPAAPASPVFEWDVESVQILLHKKTVRGWQCSPESAWPEQLSPAVKV